MVFPHLTEGEIKCLLYVSRRTFGFQKEKDRISLSQFIKGITTKDKKILDHGAGVSRPTAVSALDNLVQCKLLIVDYTTKGNVYQINLNITPDEVVKNLNQLKILTKSGKETKPKQVKLFNSQNQVSKPRDTKTIARKSVHTNLINYFWDLSKKTRGIQPLIGGKGGSQLKRVLDMDILSQPQMEKLMLYYLASPQFKSFSPDLSVLLSAGVLNVLMNKMQNDPNFYKDLDMYAQQYYKQSVSTAEANEIREKVALLKKQLSDSYAMAKVA